MYLLYSTCLVLIFESMRLPYSIWFELKINDLIRVVLMCHDAIKYFLNGWIEIEVFSSNGASHIPCEQDLLATGAYVMYYNVYIN